MADIAYAPHNSIRSPSFPLLTALVRRVAGHHPSATPTKLRFAGNAHLRDLGLSQNSVKRSFWGDMAGMDVLYPGR